MVEENVKNADLIMRLLEDPNRLLSSILVGNNLVNNGASALTTTLAIQIFRGNSGGAGIADHCDYRYHSDFRGNYS